MSKVYYMNVHSEVHENVTRNVLGSWDAILDKGEGAGGAENWDCKGGVVNS